MNKKLKNLPSLTFTGTFHPPVFPQAGHLFDLLWISPLFFNQGHKISLKKREQEMPVRVSFFLDGKVDNLV